MKSTKSNTYSLCFNIKARKTADYNQKFWENLQDEWKKLSKDNNSDHPWLSEFTDYYDPYKVRLKYL